MKYIVWRNHFELYRQPQGDGYFVKYKDKISDEFSPNWFDASKFNTLYGAVSRLGLESLKQIKSLDDFYKFNPIDKSKYRDIKISEILGESEDKFLFFERGHIDKIDDNGNLIGNAGEDVLEYIKGIIEKNINDRKSMQKKFESLGVSNYIDNSISDEEFYK